MESVVRGEEDVGIVKLPRPPKRGDYVIEQVFDGEHRCQTFLVEAAHVGDLVFRQTRQVPDEAGLVRDVSLVEARRSGQGRVLEPIRVAGGGARRLVGAPGPHGQEERRPFGRGPPDEVRRLVGKQVGVVTPNPAYLAVVVDPLAPGFAQPGEPLVPARWFVRLVVAVQVFADELGLVAAPVQPGSRRRLVLHRVTELVVSSRGPHVAPYAVIVGVLPAQNRGPAGAAHRVGDVRPAKDRAVLGHDVAQPVQVPQGMVIQVVGEDEDDVGPLGRGRRSHRADHREHHHQACQEHRCRHRSQQPNRSSHSHHPSLTAGESSVKPPSPSRNTLIVIRGQG